MDKVQVDHAQSPIHSIQSVDASRRAEAMAFTPLADHSKMPQFVKELK